MPHQPTPLRQHQGDADAHRRPLIGQVLAHMGKLSDLDVDEILAQQGASRQKFGQIALEWGLCEPEHLCEAWCAQLASGCGDRVRLSEAGVDSHAADLIPADLAARLAAIPIRSIADQVVIAAAHPLRDDELELLAASAGKHVRLVLADPAEIAAAIAAYYPAREPTAA